MNNDVTTVLCCVDSCRLKVKKKHIVKLTIGCYQLVISHYFHCLFISYCGCYCDTFLKFVS